MIQRIQSLFLLFVAIFCFFIIIHPINRMVFSNGALGIFSSFSFKAILDPPIILVRTFPIAVLAMAGGFMSFFTILKYQNRVLQMRLCGWNIIIQFLLLGAILLYYFILKDKTYHETITVTKSAFSYPVLLPPVNIILLFQAFRAIRRDDLLVKSYDRLR